MKKRFIVNPSTCTGCRNCELACAFVHAENGKLGKSRIYPIDGGFKDLWVPVACLQCDDAACVKSCLVNALKRNPETGAIELNHDICVNCKACVAACPFGCSLIDEQHELIVKCDLCGGDPACVLFCPTKALQYKPIDNKTNKIAV
ncbi:MAG: 4Fe-4S dicluster domain-containing protein [Candidatus Zixiibacteriota bacterium]|nr:MAG: 4Fe-4S dicluster domain-containing protein [candidate division Zixibacteria bacterium]